VHVSLFGNLDHDYFAELDARIAALETAERVEASYLALIDRHADRFAEAIAAVADAPPGGVLIHCAAGKDRTGLISAMLLELAGVAEDVIADDYAQSERNLAELLEKWVAEAPDQAERSRRVALSSTPRDAMLGVLRDLNVRHGGVRAFLLGAGLPAETADGAAARLR
jgi:hypothetical protein